MSAGRLILVSCCLWSLYAVVGLFWLGAAPVPPRVPPVAVAAAPPVAIKASPHYAVAPSPLTLTIAVEHHPDNRWLVVEIVGSLYYRSSLEQLEGEAAPRLRQIFYPSVPEGRYTAWATVSRAGGDTKAAHDQFCFIGDDTLCSDAMEALR